MVVHSRLPIQDCRFWPVAYNGLHGQSKLIYSVLTNWLLVNDLLAVAVASTSVLCSFNLVPKDTIRDVILTCDRRRTRVSLIYRTEPTTRNCKTEKLKIKTDMLRSKQSGESMWSVLKEKAWNEGVRGDGILLIISMNDVCPKLPLGQFFRAHTINCYGDKCIDSTYQRISAYQ